MKHICGPNCIYYPLGPDEIVREYIDGNGLKHREAVFTCGFDEHRLICFEECENYNCRKKNKLFGGD